MQMIVKLLLSAIISLVATTIGKEVPSAAHLVSVMPHCRGASIKAALSFQNLEAALPLGIPAGEPIR